MDWWANMNLCAAGVPASGPDMSQMEASIFDPWINCDDLDLGAILHQQAPAAAGPPPPAQLLPQPTSAGHQLEREFTSSQVASSNSNSSSGCSSHHLARPEEPQAAAPVQQAAAPSPPGGSPARPLAHEQQPDSKANLLSIIGHQGQLAQHQQPAGASLSSSPASATGHSLASSSSNESCSPTSQQLSYLAQSPDSGSPSSVASPSSILIPHAQYHHHHHHHHHLSLAPNGQPPDTTDQQPSSLLRMQILHQQHQQQQPNQNQNQNHLDQHHQHQQAQHQRQPSNHSSLQQHQVGQYQEGDFCDARHLFAASQEGVAEQVELKATARGSSSRPGAYFGAQTQLEGACESGGQPAAVVVARGAQKRTKGGQQGGKLAGGRPASTESQQPAQKIRRCRHITDYVLAEEEKRLLIKEGHTDFPMTCQSRPLSKSEEKILRKIRRKIRNKKSAQCSRQRKKEYVEELERKYASVICENEELKQLLCHFQQQHPNSSQQNPNQQQQQQQQHRQQYQAESSISLDWKGF